MLWYKSWIDTCWRFFLGLAILLGLASFTVMTFSTVQQMVSALPADAVAGGVPGSGALQRELQESIELMQTFRGYAWSQWFAGNFASLLTLVAALLGSGSPLVKSGSGVLFSLALPVSRARWIGTRAGVGLAELLLVALAPSLAITALAPLVGEQFAFADAVVHGVCAFVVASLFFGFAMFFSTLFNDVWRPLLLSCLAAGALAMIGMQLPEDHGLFQAMAGRDYFYGGSVPWAELALSGAAAAGLLCAAAANVARRDF